MKIIFAALILIIATAFSQPEQNSQTKGNKIKGGWSESYGGISRNLTCNC